MAKLTCMRGYPGSGKSTIAKGMAVFDNTVIVNRDLLRLMLLGEWWTGKTCDEAKVTIAEEDLVQQFLRYGNHVIVDACHVNPVYLRKWARVARDNDVPFAVRDVPTPVEACITRDGDPDRRRSGKCVGDEVIRNMAKRFPIDKWPDVKPGAKPTAEVVPYVTPPGKPEAIIVDIDGTLAHMTGRSPFDYTRVDEDAVDHTIKKLVRTWARSTYQGGDSRAAVILCSGRDASCREDTVAWLKYHNIHWDRLLMRPDQAVDDHGNKLPDWIVKLGLFNEHIRDHYDVQFVLDDRQQVVDMWRALGLKCLQVQPGEF